MTISPELHQRIRDQIATSADVIANLLVKLVAVESVTNNEGNVQRLIAEEFGNRQLDVDMWELKPDEIQPYIVHVGDQKVWKDRPNVVGTRAGSGGGPTLMMQGHVDTVPIEDLSLWTSNPAGEIRDGWVYGRGAADMKGGVASFIAALDVLDALGVKLKGDLKLATTVGEEDGGVGALSLVLRGIRADGVVITEPTDLRVICAHGGSLVFRITVPGRGAHGAHRNEGVSAFEKFIPIFQALLAWEQERNDTLSHPLFDHFENKFPISVGVVRSGSWASTVPETLIAEGRLGFLPGETIEQMMAQAEALVERVADEDDFLREHQPTVEWFGGQFASAEVSPDSPVARAVRSAHEQATESGAEIAATAAGLDLRLFTEIGKMETVAYGAGDVRYVHCPDEKLEIAAMLKAVETLALTMINFCGIAE